MTCETDMLALLHEPSPALAGCELTFLARDRIDLQRARRQHADYAKALRDPGPESLYGKAPAVDPDLPGQRISPPPG